MALWDSMYRSLKTYLINFLEDVDAQCIALDPDCCPQTSHGRFSLVVGVMAGVLEFGKPALEY